MKIKDFSDLATSLQQELVQTRGEVTLLSQRLGASEGEYIKKETDAGLDEKYVLSKQLESIGFE